jgi:hypothetical protein
MKTLLFILALVFSSIAAAQPTRTDDGCVGCHSNTGVGDVMPNDDPLLTEIDVGIDSTGNTFTFTLSGIPSGGNAALALFGMDATGLDATIGTPDTWTAQDGTSGSGTPYIWSDRGGADPFLPSGTTSYTLTFDVGSAATLSPLDTPYIIDVVFAGGNVSGSGRWNDQTSFGINVVPIPPAVWLFGSGLLGLVGIARKRAV